jgi:hypothetical protein
MAGFKPGEPRDKQGRWTDGGASEEQRLHRQNLKAIKHAQDVYVLKKRLHDHYEAKATALHVVSSVAGLYGIGRLITR